MHMQRMPARSEKMEMITFSRIAVNERWAVLGAIKEAGDTVEAIIEATRDVLLTAMDGVAHVTTGAEKAAGKVVCGAVVAASDAGLNIGVSIRSAVKGVVKGASEAGAEVGKTAMAAVDGAVKAAAEIGVDTNQAIEYASTGALEAAEEIGGGAVEAVRGVLRTAANGGQ